MIKRIIRHMRPINLTRGLEIVHKFTDDATWFDKSVHMLIEQVGDIPVRDVTAEHLEQWLIRLQSRENERKPGQKLSPWTVDSYGRALRAYFNRLVDSGHIDKSPYRLTLPKLPKKAKKSIDHEGIKRMVHYSRHDRRDHAIVLILRDSGARVSELCDMRVSGVHIEKIYKNDGGEVVGLGPNEEPPNGRETLLRGRSIVHGKMNKWRYIFFGHEACKALEDYIDLRPYGAGDELWLNNQNWEPLKPSGVYLALKRIGKRAGVEKFNPHAFRHALAEKLLKEEVPIKIIQEILGHEDVTTTMNMYMTIDNDELGNFHSKYVRF